MLRLPVSNPTLYAGSMRVSNSDGSTGIEIRAAPDTDGEARIDRFLAEAIGDLSRSRVKELIEAARVTCDGAPVLHASGRVRPGALYAVSLPPPVDAVPRPQAIGLSVLFEDDHLIVLDKPAGLVTHPAPGNEDGTLVNALLAHCGDRLPGIGGERRPGIVHRLDKDTSGVMVVAKTEAALARLSADFAARRLERSYLALVWGVPATRTGHWEGAIGRDPRDRKRMAVVARGGKPARTGFERLGAVEAGASLLRLRLETGRTHQIRVHAAAAGHPVVGDPVYLRRVPAVSRSLPEALAGTLLDFARQALHARTLGFTHPATGALLRFAAPLPADFAALIGATGLAVPATDPDDGDP